MVTASYETAHNNDHVFMFPMKYDASLNTEFQFNWVPDFICFGNQGIFPKGAWASHGGVIGAFNNRYYGTGRTNYSDLPPIFSFDDRVDQKFAARRYDRLDEYAQVLDLVDETYSPLRTEMFLTVNNMTKIQMEDLYYEIYPDYPSIVRRDYRWQNVYWLRSTSSSTWMSISQIIGWAIYLFYDLPDVSTSTLGRIARIGFTFLLGNRAAGDDKSYLSYLDPVPQNTGNITLKHYGFGGFSNLTRPLSTAVVLKDFYTASGSRRTIVGVKGLYNWLDGPINTQLISQPYLNFGYVYGGVPSTGRLMMFGAEYYGEQG